MWPTKFYLFCGKAAGSEGLHNASTYDIDRKVRQCALELNDTALLAKLSPADMVALEAKYHTRCLTALYNRARAATSSTPGGGKHDDLYSIAFGELVAYVEDFRAEESIAPVFKLADLAQMYKTRLEQLGVEIDGRVHTSRLKLRLLSVIPNLRATTQGRNVMLSFDDDIGDALQKACDYDCYNDHDAMDLVRAAKVVRREMFKQKYSFDGSFTEESLRNVVPQSLLALVNMILKGLSIEHQIQQVNAPDTAACNTISQLLMFNSVKNAQLADSSSSVSHKHHYETPILLYISMKIHAATRNRNLIDTLFSLGICVSYDRLLRLTSDISNRVCEQFTVDGIVCPPKLCSKLFTTAAVDNIDYNPSSATAKTSFHGTGISLIQHPSHAFKGYSRDFPVINKTTIATSSSLSRSTATLPVKYTNVLPASIKSKEFTAPMVDGSESLSSTAFQAFTAAKIGEMKWLETVMTALRKDQLDKNDWISWSAYHASIQEAIIPPAAINALLPLFLESAHSVAMIKHSMIIVKEAIQHLNPGQVPVLATDQPLFALAKQIQWTWPDTLGENHFVIMFGGLHIEMAILKACMHVSL